jgi:hypothetical protein
VLPNLAASIASALEEGVPGTAKDIGASLPSRPLPQSASTAIATPHASRMDHDRHLATGTLRLLMAASS